MNDCRWTVGTRGPDDVRRVVVAAHRFGHESGPWRLRVASNHPQASVCLSLAETERTEKGVGRGSNLCFVGRMGSSESEGHLETL